jgi:endoglucanase
MPEGLTGRPSTMNANPLPGWRGFNLLDFFSSEIPRTPSACRTTDDDLKWMRDWGFDFIRIPMAYPRYISFDRKNPIKAEEVCNFDSRAIDEVDRLLERGVKCGLHVSLNLHRAPGFCINAGFREPFNLWQDESAQDAFCSHWEMWAKRYREIPVKMLCSLEFQGRVRDPRFRKKRRKLHRLARTQPRQQTTRTAQKTLNS